MPDHLRCQACDLESIQQKIGLLKTILNKNSPAEAVIKADPAEYGKTEAIGKPEKPKRGRPKKIYADPGDRLVPVSFKATEKERKLLQKKADEAGLSLSCFLLKAIRDEISRTPREAA